MKAGTRVRVRCTKMARAWGYAGMLGTVTGLDPRGMNPNVVCVKLDSGPSILEAKGVNVDNLEVLRG